MSKSKAQGSVPLLITTEHRGVFFGYAPQPTAIVKEIRLENARNCVSWNDTKGFLGLASSGPKRGCKIGPSVPVLHLNAVTSITECTAEAAKAWESAPWG